MFARNVPIGAPSATSSQSADSTIPKALNFMPHCPVSINTVQWQHSGNGPNAQAPRGTKNYPATMRLFIGIALPPPLSALLAKAAHTLIVTEGHQPPRITWTRPENMHITLSFLGQVDPSRIDHIQRSLAAIHASQLHLQLNEIGRASC